MLKNVPVSYEIETIKLIFENSKQCGKCDDGYEIINTIIENDDGNTRDIVLEYSSLKSKLSLFK